MFYDSAIREYRSILEELKPYWDRGILENKVELKKFIDIVFTGMQSFAIMYYSALNDKTPELIKVDARSIRDKDIYFDQNDKIIRKSLIKIYPEIKGLESGVLRSEITNPPDMQELRKRNKNLVFIGEEYHRSITILEYEYENENKIKFLIEKIFKQGDIHGQCAYPGLATGKVRIIKRKDQVGQVEEGEIIISPMTTPDFIPAMEKAAAFVTNEGGITCHAAIVAREMNKPCIIGTKIATKVLKDGDLVEVDADRGTVKVIKKAG